MQTKEEVAERKRKYREANKEKIKEYKRKYDAANKEKISAYNKRYREENTETIQKQQRDYERNNLSRKEKAAIRGKIWRDKNKEHIRARNKKYVQNNLKKIYAQQKQRKKEDVQYHLACKLRTRLYVALRKHLTTSNKKGSAIRDLGCSLDYFKHHIESLFHNGMTWENYGDVWHIDHIYPLSAANLEDRAEFLAVNNWRNLQPLRVKHNLSKGDKITLSAKKLFNSLTKEFSHIEQS